MDDVFANRDLLSRRLRQEGHGVGTANDGQQALERIGADRFDLLLLHNPDRRGFESPEVWEALRELRDEGLAYELGIAPGPANGFTLADVSEWVLSMTQEQAKGLGVTVPASQRDVHVFDAVFPSEMMAEGTAP